MRRLSQRQVKHMVGADGRLIKIEISRCFRIAGQGRFLPHSRRKPLTPLQITRRNLFIRNRRGIVGPLYSQEMSRDNVLVFEIVLVAFLLPLLLLLFRGQVVMALFVCAFFVTGFVNGNIAKNHPRRFLAKILACAVVAVMIWCISTLWWAFLGFALTYFFIWADEGMGDEKPRPSARNRRRSRRRRDEA